MDGLTKFIHHEAREKHEACPPTAENTKIKGGQFALLFYIVCKPTLNQITFLSYPYNIFFVFSLRDLRGLRGSIAFSKVNNTRQNVINN